jgi:iron-sulfur cluster assembly protein
MNAVSITEDARNHILSVLKDLGKDTLVLGIKSGGCAGFEYYWSPMNTEEYLASYDSEIEERVKLDDTHDFVIDGTALVYLIGSKIDYKIDIMGSALTITNPNSKSSCGCGTSVNFD